ncbi:MAG: HEAT repeat domain-containing protein, partial [Planctomycetota bacterium]
MRRFLLLALVLALASGAASAQERIRGGVLPQKDKDKVRMVPRDGDPKKKDEGKKPEKKPAEAPKEEPKPTDPIEAALEKLATWPSGEARQAATALAFRGPEAEPRLIEALRTAAPALAAGICYVLGEIGGDAALPAVQGQAARTEMVEHLSVLFDAIGKLDGIGAVKRVLPFLRHPRSPARAAAETWLGERMNASHLPRLTSFLTDASAGARHSALRLLRGLAAADVARSWAFKLLDDPSPTVARTAADVLATDAGEETIPRLVEAVGKDATRRAAYSMLALVLIEDKSGVRPYSTETVMALLGAAGLRSPQKLNRGVAAIALADVGYDSEIPEVDEVLDSEVTLTLLNTIGGRTYFKDYATLAEMARERFGRLTGIRERRSIPELWEWWHAQEGVFVARRSLRKIDPARLGVFRVRARSLAEPALPSTLFSNVAADAGSPEIVGLGYIYLLPDEAAALAGTVSEELLDLPDSGVAVGSGILGPEVVVTVSLENRARTVTGRRGAVPPGLVKVVELLKGIRASHSWQTYW